MKTIDDVLKEFRVDQMIDAGVIRYVRRSMEEYARLACEEQRKICADEYMSYYNSSHYVKEKILNAPSPELK